MAPSTTPNTSRGGSGTTRRRVHIGSTPRRGQIEDRQRDLDACGRPTASERSAFVAVVARLMWSSIAVAGFGLDESRCRPFQAGLVRGAFHAELVRGRRLLRYVWSSIAVDGCELDESRYRPFQAELDRGRLFELDGGSRLYRSCRSGD